MKKNLTDLRVWLAYKAKRLRIWLTYRKKAFIIAVARWVVGLNDVTPGDLVGLMAVKDRTLWRALDQAHDAASWGGLIGKGAVDQGYAHWVARHNRKVADSLGFILREGRIVT